MWAPHNKNTLIFLKKLMIQKESLENVYNTTRIFTYITQGNKKDDAPNCTTKGLVAVFPYAI